MVQNVNPTFLKTPTRGVAIISTGSGTNPVTLYTGGTNGSKIIGINLTTSSTAATANYSLGFTTNGSTFYYMTTVSVPAQAGTVSSVGSVALLSTTNIPGLPVDSDGNPYLILASTGDSLQAIVSVTIPTAGGNTFFVTVAGDF